MELILPFDILRIIFNLLDKRSIVNYDTALLSKERRIIFLEAVKHCKIWNICKWTFLRDIHIKKGICCWNNCIYVPKTCTDLIIKSSKKWRSDSGIIYIKNNNIQKLHIDLYNSKVKITGIEGENLERIMVVNYKNIIYTEDVKKACPKLKKITVI